MDIIDKVLEAFEQPPCWLCGGDGCPECRPDDYRTADIIAEYVNRDD